MAPPYPDDSRPYSGPSRRVYPPRDDRDGRMYDDRSRSRSPGGPSHSPPTRPAADRRHEYSRERDAGQQYEDWDRDDYRHRSPPRRGRQGYRDRDLEGYKSPDYSRSRSPRRGQSGFGPESREIMLEGFPVDMTEDDIRDELQNAYQVHGLEEIRVIRDRQTSEWRNHNA
ncbi:hypothetical protein PENSUB_10091 [Penicillium subrubescens]|uniref:Uncharacterized protein n=1 Tax=Penicillium subrubescens TaxID=1316194 RepID=A0A1Q5TAM7_9EURO|nr:hypothetical protein PENSUB_10091 [Penicillium subrubescens]